MLHLPHHLRCHPSQGLTFCKDWKKSPLWKPLTERLGLKITDGTLMWMLDSSHQDCDKGRLTTSCFGFFQGGLASVNSFVPQPIPHSTAESEIMGIGTGTLACAHTRKAVSNSLFSDPNKPWTVPFPSDGQAAIAMNDSEQPTKCNEHVDKCCFFVGLVQIPSKKLLASRIHHTAFLNDSVYRSHGPMCTCVCVCVYLRLR